MRITVAGLCSVRTRTKPARHDGVTTFDRHELSLHGQSVTYRTAGSGPVLLLLHGITNSSETWEPAVDALAQDFRVIAPDLLGHGHSATPRGDYSLGAHASGVRDLLSALDFRPRDGGRALARRRRRDAVRLPVPGALRAARARLQRRARQGGPPAAARRGAARRRLGPADAHLARGARRRAGDRRRAAPRPDRARRRHRRARARFASLDTAGSRSALPAHGALRDRHPAASV